MPTKQNPADLLTRGQSVCQLKDERCWWEGPAFLMLDESEWPTTKIDQKDTRGHKVPKRFLVKQGEISTFVSTTTEDRLTPTRYSSWRRLTRVLATVPRFPDNCGEARAWSTPKGGTNHVGTTSHQESSRTSIL